MIPDFKYNHDANNFNESIGVDENFQDETMKKINLIVNTLSKNENLHHSTILEEMIAVCSDEQIAFLALNFISEQIREQIKNSEL